MPVATETTPTNDGSLETAGSLMEGLLSVTPEESVPPKKQSEQVPATEPEPEQTPPAPEPEEAGSEEEPETPPKTADEEPPQSRKLKVDDQTEITEEEAIKGYLRTQDYTRKTQALADERRKFEEGLVAVARERDNQYAQHLAELKNAIQALTPAEPDWQKLRQEVTPDVFAAELLNWKQQQDRVKAIETEQQAVAARQAEDAKRGYAQYVAEQEEKLETALPILKDPEKGVALKRELVNFAIERGFTPEDLKSVTDHRLVLVLHDAMQHAKAKAKAPKIENKIERVIEASAPGATAAPSKKNALGSAKERLARSGRVEDAGLAISHLLE